MLPTNNSLRSSTATSPYSSIFIDAAISTSFALSSLILELVSGCSYLQTGLSFISARAETRQGIFGCQRKQLQAASWSKNFAGRASGNGQISWDDPYNADE